MIFGPVTLDEAEGAVLAHSVRVDGRTFKKGRVLNIGDIEQLRALGHERVIAARLEADDVAEDEAAAAITASLTGEGADARAPFTGRCNVISRQHGLLVVDVERIERLNRVHEALTVATLANFTVVRPKQMIATVKVIPFSAPRAAVDQWQAIAKAAGAVMEVRPFLPLGAGLIQTRLPDTKESVLDKTTGVLSRRLAALGGRIAGEIRCEHQEDAVSKAVRELLESGVDVVLIAGASAIVDRRDVLPAGIERAGGRVEHYGMPVDPGNLLLLARHGDRSVVGLPGCARSPKFNGFDYVLQRFAAGVPVSPEDIMGMGVGGLLKDVAERPLPRASTMAPAESSASVPRIAALILAAGQSRRMGSINKLLAEIDDVPMVARVADGVAASAAEPVWVVTGHEPARVEAALAGHDFPFVHNPDYGSGLSTSLAAGVARLPDDVDGVLVCLGDMPRVTAAQMDRLIAAFDPAEGRSICVPTYRGKRGNPILWSKRFFAEMQGIHGDVGARHLIGENEDQVCEVEMEDGAVLLDVDSPAALAALRQEGLQGTASVTSVPAPADAD